METIERIDDWRERYQRWKRVNELRDGDVGEHYPWVENRRAPFKPMGRALPMLNLGLITSAGAYIDGTEAFDTTVPGGDATYREIPTLVTQDDLRFAARGYDPAAVEADMNSQVPLARLYEFEGNGIIGQLNPVFWSLCGFIPSAARFATQTLPELVERVKRYNVQAALLIPASRLCHQTMGLTARALEAANVPTMMLSVDREATEQVRPPRAVYYNGEFGSVAGRPNFGEHQRRILDEALRLLEPTDQVSIRKLNVEMETLVEGQRGER
ncbi:MAG TPA: glycine/sarcosine/betaine reductase selenoprotein B family protein [Pyrinomonadaceae bacterium]|nr:glycine/sarcosine/betaine reductase selenoprotein B family protein [Pyrinomonadaceae bacterium]